MARSQTNIKTVVAEVRAQTRARLATIRLERLAYREAQRRRLAAPVSDDPAPVEAGAPLPTDAALSEPVAELPPDKIEASESERATAFDSAPEGVPGESDREAPRAVMAAPAPTGPRAMRLRIAAAIGAATAGYAVVDHDTVACAPLAMPDDAPEPEPAPVPPSRESITPLSALKMIGPGLTRRLSALGIDSVADLAGCDLVLLRSQLGVIGQMINIEAIARRALAACQAAET
jgi:nucleotidyltransferase/DNA polymerase involved in DNA repair